MEKYIKGAIISDIRIKKSSYDMFGDEKSIEEITRKFRERIYSNKEKRIPPGWIYTMPIQERQV